MAQIGSSEETAPLITRPGELQSPFARKDMQEWTKFMDCE